MIIQLLKFNIKSNILVRQLLNLVIFHLSLNKPHLLLLWVFFSLFIFLGLSDVLNGVAEAFFCSINSMLCLSFGDPIIGGPFLPGYQVT